MSNKIKTYTDSDGSKLQISYKYGSIFYYKNGKRHRLDGPAIELYNGIKEWYKEGKLHRVDSPAIEYINGYKAYYIEGKLINSSSQEEFERIINLKLFW